MRTPLGDVPKGTNLSCNVVGMGNSWDDRPEQIWPGLPHPAKP
jgi:hypothetical protein